MASSGEQTAGESESSSDTRAGLSTGGKFLLVLVGIVLTLSLVGTAAILTGHQTVLSAEFAKDSAAESGLYGTFQEDITEGMSNDLEGAGSPEDPFAPEIDSQAVANEAVTEDFVRTQVGANIDRLYGFLHGERDTLELVVETDQLRSNIADEIGADARDIDLAAVVDEATAGVDTEIEDTGVEVPLNGETFERMDSGETAYNEEREQFQAELEAVALDRAFQEREPRELLPLIDENPQEYTEEERQQIVREREDEIKSELVETEEFNEEFEQALGDWRDSAVEQIDTQVTEQAAERDGDVEEPVRELHVAMVDGLFTDQSHSEFTDRVDQVRTDLGDEAERLARERVQENFPEEIDMSEGMGAEDEAQFAEVARYVQLSGTLGWGLFVLSLLLAGGSYALSRSPVATLLTVGSSVTVSGVALLVGGAVGGDWLLGQMSAGIQGSDPMAEFLLVMLEGTFGFMTNLSLALLVGGLVLLGVGVAIHKQYIDLDR